jgi:two-component system, NtrC family, sensor kinase
VIAIENVRLFNETKEALEQQTATSEILGVISQSPTDVQPVFDAIVRSAVRLCGGMSGNVWRLRENALEMVASHNVDDRLAAIAREAGQRRGLDRSLLAGRAIQDRAVVNVPDVSLDPEYDPELARHFPRGALSVPMLKDGAPIGAITVTRAVVGLFSEKQIALLKTFADQAVIAIENVRLFTELESRNRDLTTALDEKTATSEILRVISQSPTDVQPVFDSIIASAVRLLAADNGTLTRVVGDNFELAAFVGTGGAGDAALRAAFPWSLQAEGAHTKAVRDRTSINIADAQTDPGVSETRRALARVYGYRSLAVVPLLRHDEALGTIGDPPRAGRLHRPGNCPAPDLRRPSCHRH